MITREEEAAVGCAAGRGTQAMICTPGESEAVDRASITTGHSPIDINPVGV